MAAASERSDPRKHEQFAGTYAATGGGFFTVPATVRLTVIAGRASPVTSISGRAMCQPATARARTRDAVDTSSNFDWRTALKIETSGAPLVAA